MILSHTLESVVIFFEEPAMLAKYKLKSTIPTLDNVIVQEV